jgi:prepilin-type N-terminal cleavage/methylation domain-containing protein
MKTILIKSNMTKGDQMADTARSRHVQLGLQPSAFSLQPFRHAFTLVEMLVVIAIIAILAALLLPVLAGAKKAAQKKQAAIEISQIVGGIQQYDSIYGRFPVSSDAQAAAAKGNGDFTYGAAFQTPAGPALPCNLVNTTYAMSNCEVIAILMNFTNFPNGTGWTINTNYQKNPQQTIFLNAKMSGWDPSQGGLPVAGVGNDLVYRDPWGSPYVISLDLNYDEQCQDAFYSSSALSSGPSGTNSAVGLHGLVNPDGTANNYRYHGKVMVWSAGPDKMIDPNAAADTGANKDNILSWQ